MNFQRKEDFMKEYLSVIRSSRLFSGISEEELITVLNCLDTKTENFPKNAFLLHSGDAASYVGFVLSGAVLVIQEDIWGNRNILSRVGAGQTFAAAYACAGREFLDVGVIAEAPVTALFLNIKRVLGLCPSGCGYHSRIIENLLGETAEKNLRLNEKLTHMGQRSTRAKLMSYLSAETQHVGGYEFDIPFSRQQLADYLGVERSGLSLELGKMKRDGLIDFNKSHFVIKPHREDGEKTVHAER